MAMERNKSERCEICVHSLYAKKIKVLICMCQKSDMYLDHVDENMHCNCFQKVFK